MFLSTVRWKLQRTAAQKVLRELPAPRTQGVFDPDEIVRPRTEQFQGLDQ